MASYSGTRDADSWPGLWTGGRSHGSPSSPLATWYNWGTSKMSQQEGLCGLLSSSYLQYASVHSTSANIWPNVQSYRWSPGPPLVGQRGSERFCWGTIYPNLSQVSWTGEMLIPLRWPQREPSKILDRRGQFLPTPLYSRDRTNVISRRREVKWEKQCLPSWALFRTLAANH